MIGWLIPSDPRGFNMKLPFVSRQKFEMLQEEYKELTWQLFQTIIQNRQLKEKLDSAPREDKEADIIKFPYGWPEDLPERV
jgi:hypothetical protein